MRGAGCFGAAGRAILRRPSWRAERTRELVVNVVLPFAALDPALREKALSLLGSMPPAAAYSKTAFLEANLRRADGKRRVRGVLEQQGLLSLLADWCSQGGCGRCPLSPA